MAACAGAHLLLRLECGGQANNFKLCRCLEQVGTRSRWPIFLPDPALKCNLPHAGPATFFRCAGATKKLTRGRWCGIVVAQTVLWAMGHDKPSGTAPALPLLRSGRRVVVGGLLKRNGRRLRHRRLWQWTLHACAICAPGRGARLMARSCSGVDVQAAAMPSGK